MSTSLLVSVKYCFYLSCTIGKLLCLFFNHVLKQWHHFLEKRLLQLLWESENIKSEVHVECHTKLGKKTNKRRHFSKSKTIKKIITQTRYRQPALSAAKLAMVFFNPWLAENLWQHFFHLIITLWVLPLWELSGCSELNLYLPQFLLKIESGIKKEATQSEKKTKAKPNNVVLM